MGRKSLIITSLVLIATLRITAQSGPSTFEFIENKGQWDSRVKFQGEIPAGVFYLQQKGFMVVQHNTKDLDRFFRHEHGSPANGSANGGANSVNAASARKPNGKQNDEHVDPFPGEGGNSGSNKLIIHSHAYRVEFIGGNENSEIVPDKVVPSYNNYLIGDDPTKWASNVKIFQAVVYKNVYPNIDVRYYSEYGRLKYDLIVHPGADVTKILMRYDGADKLSIKNNELIIKTSVGEVKELYPYSYQFDTKTGKKEVACKYELADKNTVRFKVSDYAKTSTLIIDPTLIFSSYTGSRAGEYGFTATPGPDGSLYAGSIVFGVGFITTTGAFQTSFQGGTTNGGTDIGITKFSPFGNVRLYATYIGGKNANEYPHSLICDPQGNLVIMGRTYSNDYPTFPAGNVVGTGGGGDIVVTKLNANGTAPIGSMRIGGSGTDGSNVKDMQEGASLSPATTLRFYGDDSRSEVILDGNNNIYVAAQSRPSAVRDSFPIRGAVFQATPGGGQDGVVMKIAPNCQSVTWSSYIGGANDDGAFVIAVNPSNNEIYVGGATSSNNMPGVSPGAYQAGFQGGQADGFVSRIRNDGSAIIQTSYMGTNGFDAVYGVKFDNSSIPYIMGISEGGWKAQNATFSNPGSCQFIGKLRPDLSGFIYTTVFGSGAPRPNISPVAFLVDRCENVYISGWGGWIQRSASDPFNMSGTLGMPVTPDAIKSNTDNMDFYFFVLKKDATQQLYGSFFGQSGGEGEHVDGGTSRFDASGIIYQAICANCFGNQAGNITTPFPIRPGVIGPVNGTGTQNCNLAAVKIAFNFSGVQSGPKSYLNGIQDTLGCVPFTVVLRDTIRNAKSYIWSFGDGSPDSTTTNFEISHTFTAIGTYRVRLIAIDSTTCNIRDTAYLNIRVRDDQAFLAMLATKLPPCQSLTYEFDNRMSTAPPGKPFSNTSFVWDFGDGTPTVTGGLGTVVHGFAAAGTYIVRLTLVDTNYCNAPETLVDTLRISPLVDARFETPPFGCVPYDAFFNNTSLAGRQFFWNFGDGTTSTDDSPIHTYNNIGTYTIKLVAIDSSTCNIIDSVEHTIVVSEKPTAEFNTTPVPALENTPTVFHNLSIGGNRYKWLFGDGDSVVVTTMDTVNHQYNATGTYEACLITYNQYDCTDTACHPVNAVIVPLLDVPNAFTPGRFGRNSVVRVEGFGIGKMIWKIYNRWGQVVFETNNRKLGWDGTFKGQLQPMDVYAYTLDVQFTDGTTTRKTGDITLIR